MHRGLFVTCTKRTEQDRHQGCSCVSAKPSLSMFPVLSSDNARWLLEIRWNAYIQGSEKGERMYFIVAHSLVVLNLPNAAAL